MNNNLFTYEIPDWEREPATAFDAFMAEYNFEGRGLRKSSFVVYKGMFVRLLQYLTARGVLLPNLDEALLDEFFSSRRLSVETRHRYLLVFTALYRYLAQLQDTETNPARALLLQSKVPERDAPESLTPLEVEALFEAWPQAKTWKHARGKALACVILGSGLRSSEILDLKTQDVNTKNGVIEGIWVKRQGVKLERSTPLQPFADTVLREWLAQLVKLRIPGTRVFPADATGGALSPATLFRQIQAALARAKISRRYEGPTLLRNTCGAMWLAKNPALKVQQWLGHELLRTTEQLQPAAETWQGARAINA